MAGSLLNNGATGSKEILFNDLQNSAQTLNEHIEKISAIMRECGLTPVMTGSGATVVGYGNKDQFDLAKDKLCANNYTSRVVAFNKKGYETL